MIINRQSREKGDLKKRLWQLESECVKDKEEIKSLIIDLYNRSGSESNNSNLSSQSFSNLVSSLSSQFWEEIDDSHNYYQPSSNLILEKEAPVNLEFDLNFELSNDDGIEVDPFLHTTNSCKGEDDISIHKEVIPYNMFPHHLLATNASIPPTWGSSTRHPQSPLLLHSRHL